MLSIWRFTKRMCSRMKCNLYCAMARHYSHGDALKRATHKARANHIQPKTSVKAFRYEITKNMVEPLLLLGSSGSPRGSGCYWLLCGSPLFIYFICAGAAGGGLTLKVSIRNFQVSPS